MAIPVACVRFLLTERSGELTGKTISASFDPWDTSAFEENVARINSSDLYTLRRINLKHLTSDGLRAELETAAHKRGGEVKARLEQAKTRCRQEQ
jgi:hypothetical protein